MSELHELSISEAHRRLTSREISATELTQAVLERIERTEPGLRSFITVTPELALDQARNADAKLATGEPVGPLCGIPMAIKEIILTRGIRTTAGSKMLDSFIAPYDASVTQRVR